MSIDALFNEIETARASWNALNDLLVQSKYDFSRARPILDQQSMEMFRRRADLVFETLLALRPDQSDGVAAIVIGARSAEIRKHVQNFKKHTDASASQLRSGWKDGATIRDGNENFLWQLFDGDANLSSADVTPNFEQINSSLNFLLGVTGSLLPLCKAESVGDLSTRAEALAGLVREIESFRKQAEQHIQASDASAGLAEKHEQLAADARTQAETVLATLRELLQQANADSSSVKTLVEQIKTTGSNAEKLEALVGGYQSKFEAFQAELDGRNNEFSQFQLDSKAAKDANSTRENEIDRLTKLADAMISGATTAGLGKSLEDARERYEVRMNSARTGFQVSIFFLVLSAIPLAAHLLPGLFGDWFPKVSETVHENWYGVLGKVLLMVPATWLTGFYTKTYADFFHLEREYAHKAALAGAVDGFKRQAPQYQEEITAEVFLEIRNNPAKGQSVEPAAHPLYDVLAKTVGKVMDKNKES
jgi:hypothetical protein